MHLRRLLSISFAAVILLTLAGCNTFKSRVRENAPVFNALDAATQARLKAGQVRIGDTTTEVYIALGQPDTQYTATTADGSSILWIYSRYWQQYEGQGFVGTAPVYVSNSSGGKAHVRYLPVYQPVYQTRTETVLRVTFTHDHVSLIEKPIP